MTIKSIYTGNLHTEAHHIDSGAVIVTDAPKDNQGEGAAFSPTDLLSASLGSCMLTLMGITARRDGINIEGTTAEITKVMSSVPPRRVAEVNITVTLPAGLSLSDKERKMLEASAHSCPVSKSLHPEIKQQVTFIY